MRRLRVADLCRKHGISPWMFYQWRNKYGRMSVKEAKQLRELEESRPPKKIVADRALRSGSTWHRRKSAR
jgi:putative transposase